MNNQTFTIQNHILALSWKEPFASLMLKGKIETRTWPTTYRGWVLICASKAGYHTDQIRNIAGNRNMWRIIDTLEGNEEDFRFYHGHAIAIGRLVDCRPMQPEDEDKCFVKYYPDLFCHIYEDVQAIEPFPWKGSQGWKTLIYFEKQQIKLL